MTQYSKFTHINSQQSNWHLSKVKATTSHNGVGEVNIHVDTTLLWKQ